MPLRSAPRLAWAAAVSAIVVCAAVASAWAAPSAAAASAAAADRILLFTKTAGTRENNMADSRRGLKAFYEAKGLAVDTSENAALFSDTGLAKYKAIVLLKTTGDFLNDAQQTAFEKWFKAGGGAQIIHAALDAETNWAFYGKLIGGAYFQSLPGDSNTVHSVIVEDSLDRSTLPLPRPWQRMDEIYGFRANPRAAKDPAMHILLKMDESSYKNGKPGTDHPMSWYCEYLGGRAWTTAMGHITPVYTAKTDSLFLYHLWGGMEYLLKREVVPIAFPAAKRKPAGPALRAFAPSGARFGEGLEKDARGRRAVRGKGGPQD
jgi:type 1 glutamine amidotransferase